MKVAAALFLVLATVAGAGAEAVGGFWYFSSAGAVKIGLVKQPDDLHSHFMNLECANSSATGPLDFEPRVLGTMVAEDRYAKLRSRRGDTSVSIGADRIQLMDSAPYAWALAVTADRDLFEQWSKPGKVTLELGYDEGQTFVTVAAYELPSAKREEAARGFLRVCFG